jgi:UDP-N-acetylmuramoyl-tripeptide--D-alanyl-D-alanine ligase
MSLWTKSEIIEALSGELLEHNLHDNLEIDEVVIDSRKTPKSGLFVALKGEKNDAHDFVEQAIANGCKAAIVDRITNHELGITNFLVKDTFAALYKLAEFSRKRSQAKIIGLTGSVGKTGTKDMLEMIFKTQGKTFATLGNLNNHIGVPLTLCNFPRDCDFGIFEMGMNHAGEIEPLSKLVKPHLAVITNVGPVHIEFFENEQGIAAAKSEIFAGLIAEKIALLNFDNPHFEFLKQRAQGLKIFTFGKKTGADYQILNNSIEVKLPGEKKISYQINSLHPAAISNSIIAIACLDLLGSDFAKGLSAFKNLESKAGRGEISEINGITIIDETYNASLLSMQAGLEYANNVKAAKNKKRIIAALGDMFELGEKSAEIHQKTVGFLQEFNIDFAILVGKEMSEAAKNLPQNSYKTFPDSTSAAQGIKDFLKDGDVLYVKGSRGMKMEKIIQNFTNHAH